MFWLYRAHSQQAAQQQAGATAYSLPGGAQAGAMALTGTVASLEKGFEVAADSAAYLLTGTAASLEKGFEVAADATSVALTGTDAGLRRTATVTADSTAVVLTGTDATLVHAYAIVAQAGTVAISGTDAGTLLGRRVAADTTAVAISQGVETLVKAGRRLVTQRDEVAGYQSIAPSTWDTGAASGNINSSIHPPTDTPTIDLPPLSSSFELRELWVYLNVTAGRDTTIPVGLIDVNTGTASTKPRLYVTNVPVRAADGTGWRWVGVTGIAADFSAHSGKRLAAAMGRPADGALIQFRYNAVTPTGGWYISGRGADLSLPDPFPSGGSAEQVSLYAVFNAVGSAVTSRGTDAGVRSGRLLTAEQGSTALTGQDATLRRTYRVVAESASIVTTGTDASLERAFTLAADPASFALTGTLADLETGRKVAADPTAVVVTGTDATLIRVPRIVAETGAVVITGSVAGTLMGREVLADATSLALTGTDAGLDFAVWDNRPIKTGFSAQAWS